MILRVFFKAIVGLSFSAFLLSCAQLGTLKEGSGDQRFDQAKQSIERRDLGDFMPSRRRDPGDL